MTELLQRVEAAKTLARFYHCERVGFINIPKEDFDALCAAVVTLAQAVEAIAWEADHLKWTDVAYYGDASFGALREATKYALALLRDGMQTPPERQGEPTANV